MPFKNDRYEPDNTCEKNMKKFISDYLRIPKSGCRRDEYEALLAELTCIETEFFRQFDSSTVRQDLKFQDKKNFEAKAMQDFAIPRVLEFLNELYEQRDKSKSSRTKEFMKAEKDIPKKIWKERCKERERCPRAGVIIISDDKVLLVKHKTDNCTNYGYSKGKIEYGETIKECAAREPAEELGLPVDVIYDLIKDSSRITKNVPYTYDGVTKIIEHYYFIIILPKDYDFRPNKFEIDGIELRSTDRLPCCRNCSENPLIEYDDEVEEHSHYYMAKCANFTAASSLVSDILNFMDKKNGNNVVSNKYKEKHRHCQRKTN